MEKSMLEYKEIEEKVFKQISSSFNGKNYLIERESKIGSYAFRFDIAIFTSERHPVCIIEVKANIKNVELTKLAIRNHLISVNTRYAIITDGKTYLLFDALKKEKDFQNLTLATIVKDLISEKIESKFPIFCNNINQLLADASIDIFVTEKDLDIKEGVVCLEAKLENKLIKSLFNFSNKDVTKVYRYTTLNTLFEMINKKSILMFGLAGMNDVSEIDYIGKEIYSNLDYLYYKDINKIFISSCSLDKEDDLTQWRLYAKNGEGVCLTFEVDTSKADFKFFKIQYMDAKKNELINLLKNIVNQCIKDTGYSFVYNSFHEWSHFIKPLDYEVENEVRLLYKMKEKDTIDGWILSNETNIINPYKKFSLNDSFPLRLKEITLGPKCKESDLNVIQLNEMKKTNVYFKDVKIKISNIKNYR